MARRHAGAASIAALTFGFVLVGCGGGDAAAPPPQATANSGGGNISGMFNATPIQPFVSGIWIGKPDMPLEAGGGPFIFLFTQPVSCGDLSVRNRWLDLIPAGTQVLELIVGTTTPGVPVPVTHSAASGMVEVNYSTGMQLGEHQARAGSVTLTTYEVDKAIEGTVDVEFPIGSAKGAFRAIWCPSGLEI